MPTVRGLSVSFGATMGSALASPAPRGEGLLEGAAPPGVARAEAASPRALSPECFDSALAALAALRVADAAPAPGQRALGHPWCPPPAWLRRQPGRAFSSRPLADRARLLRGSSRNAGLVPQALADAIVEEGRSLSGFGHLRETLWRAVSASAYAAEFGEVDQALMRSGRPPQVPAGQAVGQRRAYELHHIRPVARGGAPLDLSNLCIVTPRYHMTVLHPRYHFGRASAPAPPSAAPAATSAAPN